MGDDNFLIVSYSIVELGLMERLYLNINRNMISYEAMVEAFKEFERLGMMYHVEIDAKRNLRKIEDKEEVRTVINSLQQVKSKKIDL